MIGFYFSSITPSSSGGQPAQVYFMKKDNIEVGHSSLSLLVMVMFYQIAMLASALVLFILQGTLIKDNFGGVIYLVIYGTAVNLILIVCIGTVSYTHLDVYKRQAEHPAGHQKLRRRRPESR